MDLTWLPAWQIRELIAKREVSPVEVVDHFLGRAEQLDPILRCFRTLDASGARAQAKRAEESVLRGDALEVLHGVPVTVKEHIAVAGLPVLRWNDPTNRAPADHDALVVERLRQAGAIVIGTNVMPGMGTAGLLDSDGQPTTDLSWHSRNPWDVNKVPGYSSAGSSAAVGAGVVPIAITSDGAGSTRMPGALNGLVGVHPTMGRVPLGGPPGITWSSSLGPLTRDVRDNATVLQAIAGPDGGEVISLQSDPPNYLGELDGGLEGVRFAWTDDYGFARSYASECSERVIAAVRSAADGFTQLGAAVEPIDDVFDDSLGMMGMMQPNSTEEAFREAQAVRARWWAAFGRIFAIHDVIVTPTTHQLAVDVEEFAASIQRDPGFAAKFLVYTSPNNVLGWPALAVPCGFVDGLPVSLQLIGRPDTEPLLYRAANALLRAFPRHERPPIALDN